MGGPGEVTPGGVRGQSPDRGTGAGPRKSSITGQQGEQAPQGLRAYSRPKAGGGLFGLAQENAEPALWGEAERYQRQKKRG